MARSFCALGLSKTHSHETGWRGETEVIGKTSTRPWLRSLFNGLARIILQSTGDAGEFKLTAS